MVAPANRWGDTWLSLSQEVKEATARTKALRASTPYATAAHYDRKSKNVIVNLSNGMGLFFSPQDAQGLEDATPAQLSEIEITPSGFGLFFPKLDEGINVPNLLEGTMVSHKWMAARLGAQGGKAPRSPSAPPPAPTELSTAVPASPLPADAANPLSSPKRA
jgi:hypothetical protein